MMQILLKKIRNHLKPLKLQQNKNLSQFTQQGGFKKVADAVRNSELFRIWSSSFNVQGYDAHAKINAFSQLTLHSSNLVLTSYLSGIFI